LSLLLDVIHGILISSANLIYHTYIHTSKAETKFVLERASHDF